MLRESGLAATAGQNAGKSVGKQSRRRHATIARRRGLRRACRSSWQRVGHRVNEYATPIDPATPNNDACPPLTAQGRRKAPLGTHRRRGASQVYFQATACNHDGGWTFIASYAS